MFALDSRMLGKLVSAAIDLFLRTQKSDQGVFEELIVRNGIGEDEASALITFVPLAFCRAWFAGSGIAFPKTYFVSSGHGGGTAERSFLDNGIFVEASRQARHRIDQGMARDDLFAVVSRSAEFRAINNALLNGVRLGDVKVAQVVLITTAPEGSRSLFSHTGASSTVRLAQTITYCSCL